MIDYKASAAKAFERIKTLDRFGLNYEEGGALAIHAANFRDAGDGLLQDHGENDHFFRQGERFLRLCGCLVEK